MARPASFRATRSATVSLRRLPSTSSTFMDALKIEKADPRRLRLGCTHRQHRRGAVAGARSRRLVSVSGYLIGNQEAGKMPLPPQAELQWWYQFYFATERGRAGYEKNRYDFNKLIWQIASPKWSFDDATFERSAAAFDNPDHVDIVIHNYRWRLGLVDGETKYDELEKRLAAGTDDHRSDHHDGRRCQRCAHPDPRSTPTSSRAVRAPEHHAAASATTCRRRIQRLSSMPSLTSPALDCIGNVPLERSRPGAAAGTYPSRPHA